MCEFISWVDVDGKLYYLTDDEIYSDKFRELGCRDNDALGHGAIRAFYGLGNRGTNQEQRNFWVVSLPEELKLKLNDFDRWWGRIFSEGIFRNADLRYIIYYAPDEWRVRAWEQLMKQTPTTDNLRDIICNAPDEWRERAWKQLMKQTPTTDDLQDIIIYAPDVWRARASEQLMGQSPTTEDLRFIIRWAPDVWRERASEQLMGQSPTTEDLQDIIRWTPEPWKSKAQELLDERTIK